MKEEEKVENNVFEEEKSRRKTITKITPGNLLEFYTLGYMINKGDKIYIKEITDNLKMMNITWDISHGTYYPVIKNMTRNNYIKYLCNFDTKKYYEVTEEGKKYYDENASKYKELLQCTSDFYLKVLHNLP